MIPQETIPETVARPETSAGAIPGAVTKTRPATMDAVLTRAWARWLIPSFADLFFVAALMWLFMGAYGWLGLLADADVGWHIRTGQYILAHQGVPHHDLYSFSKPGAPWYAWEWLSDIIYAGLYNLAGLKGVVLAAGVLIAVFATSLVLRIIRRGVHMFIGIVVALLGVGSASMHFLARPHIFTLVLISLSMWLLETDRDGEAPARRIWWLVPIALVWTNLHGGFVVLIAVLGLAAVGAGVEAWLAGDRHWAPALRYVALSVFCAAASLVNPYGWGLHVHVLEYLRSDWIRNVVQEFQSPSFRNENMLQFEGLLFAGLIGAGALLRRRRVIEALWILFFAYLSLSSVRHVPVFVAVVLPLIAAEIGGWWSAWAAGSSRKSALGILNQMGSDAVAGFRRFSVWPVIIVLVLALMGAPIPWPRDFPSQLFPTTIVHAHEADLLHSRVLTTDQWADYLIYLHPEQKVFVDGRSDFYGPEIGNQFLRLVAGAPEWQSLMQKYQFDRVLLPTDQPLIQLLKQSGKWRVIADDGKRIYLGLGSPSVPPTVNLPSEPRF